LRQASNAHLAVAVQAPRVLPPPLLEHKHLSVQELLLQAAKAIENTLL
jgi:hypothetical protein